VSARRSDGVNVISSVSVHEVSPVLLAASIGTHTISAKDAEVLEAARRNLDAWQAEQAAREASVLAAGKRHADAYAASQRADAADLRRIRANLVASTN